MCNCVYVTHNVNGLCMFDPCVWVCVCVCVCLQVILEAVAGNGYLGDIAVDDVLIGPCSSLSYLDTSK